MYRNCVFQNKKKMAVRKYNSKQRNKLKATVVWCCQGYSHVM